MYIVVEVARGKTNFAVFECLELKYFCAAQILDRFSLCEEKNDAEEERN